MEYICKYCSKTYKSIHSRSNHYRIYHKKDLLKSNPKVTLESSNRNFYCKYCNNIYKYKQGKYKHEQKCKNTIKKENDIIKKENEELKSKNLELTNKLDQLLKLFKIHPKDITKD
jgi:hypothetical protein